VIQETERVCGFKAREFSLGNIYFNYCGCGLGHGTRGSRADLNTGTILLRRVSVRQWPVLSAEGSNTSYGISHVLVFT
jgi:hypothetical protein